MSQSLGTTGSYFERTANVPTRTAGTIAAWVYPPTLPAADRAIFGLHVGATTELACLRWSSAGAIRAHNAGAGSSCTSNPTAAAWYYIFLRWDGTNVDGGWKAIADSDFTGRTTGTIATLGSGTPDLLRVGVNPAQPNALVAYYYRLSVWDARVSDANLLLAAATDKGYTTNLNTHLPLTDGIASPWADTSGNARDWTTSGTFSNQSDPSLGGGGGIPKTTRFALMGVG